MNVSILQLPSQHGIEHRAGSFFALALFAELCGVAFNGLSQLGRCDMIRCKVSPGKAHGLFVDAAAVEVIKAGVFANGLVRLALRLPLLFFLPCSILVFQAVSSCSVFRA